MSEQEIRIERHELFDPAVDEALAREHAGRERIVTDTEPVSLIRRLMHNSLIYLPLAAAIAALSTWLLIEPNIADRPRVRGEIILVNAEPFSAGPGFVALTVGSHEVLVHPTYTRLEPGAEGEPAFASVDGLEIGDRIEAVGLEAEVRLVATAIRPTASTESLGEIDQPAWPLLVLFPLTAALIAFALLFSEGITTRNWIRMTERSLLGSFLAALFAMLAFIPAELIWLLSQYLIKWELESQGKDFLHTVGELSIPTFLGVAACRSAAWACIGAAMGVGMNLVRSTRTQLRNSVIGGALGGAFGGLFFDPIDRFFTSSPFSSVGASRLVGLLAVGIAVGLFVALIERLARDAWLRVRTGPLAGKSFILYKTPTVVGASPQSDVYLYKDAEIDPAHVSIHRVGTTYEIEDMGTRMGTSVGGTKVRRRRLVSGDQIVIGSTLLDFEERQKRTPRA
jgi:hypothetical protein